MNELNKSPNEPMSVQLNGQYIKELSFLNQNSPASFLPQKEHPKIEVAINFNNRKAHEENEIYEVYLTLKANTQSMDDGNMKLFEVKLVYVGLVTLNNIESDEQKDAILNIHVPTLLFPYARHILSDVTRDGGFQPLMLEPLDFAKIHQERKIHKESNQTMVEPELIN